MFKFSGNMTKELAISSLAELIAAFDDKNAEWQQNFKAEIIEPYVRQLVSKVSEKPGPMFMVIRVALTGRTATPGLFETMEVLGRDITLKRLQNAIETLNR